MTDKEDKTVRQFVLFCRTALMYEKKNYYNRCILQRKVRLLTKRWAAYMRRKSTKSWQRKNHAMCSLSMFLYKKMKLLEIV